MLKPLLLAACALASSLFSAAAGAQTTYKCGNSYSQQPCPGGTVIDTADPRTSAQKKQAEQAIQRNAKLASELEKSRLQQEKADLAKARLARHRPKTNHQQSRTGRSKNSLNSSPKTLRRWHPRSQVKKAGQKNSAQRENIR